MIDDDIQHLSNLIASRGWHLVRERAAEEERKAIDSLIARDDSELRGRIHAIRDLVAMPETLKKELEMYLRSLKAKGQA